MAKESILKNSQIIILGVCMAAATIISAVILAQGSLKIMKFTKEVIQVTGSAQKDILSDYIVWRSTFVRRGADVSTAYKELKEDLRNVKGYLLSKGIAGDELAVSPVTTETIYRKNNQGNDTSDVQGFRLSQEIQVYSHDVGKVDKVSRESTELMDQGIEFSSQSPEYFYTKLDDLKVEMLAKATGNAKQRAATMAQASGSGIGVMRSAKMGVFQITPANSTAVSDYGMNDTSSWQKKVTAVVTVSFAIE